MLWKLNLPSEEKANQFGTVLTSVDVITHKQISIVFDLLLFVVIDVEFFFGIVFGVVVAVVGGHIILINLPLLILLLNLHRPRRPTHLLKHLQHIMKLPMKVSTYVYWCLDFEEVWLTPEDTLGFFYEPFY